MLEIGSEVVIDNDIKARIRAIEIRGPQRLISYQCVWWEERQLKSEWFYSDEIEPWQEKHRTVGVGNVGTSITTK